MWILPRLKPRRRLGHGAAFEARGSTCQGRGVQRCASWRLATTAWLAGRFCHDLLNYLRRRLHGGNAIDEELRRVRSACNGCAACSLPRALPGGGRHSGRRRHARRHPRAEPGARSGTLPCHQKKTEAARPWERKRSDRLTAVEGRRSNRGRRVTYAALPAHKLKPRPTSVSWLLRQGLQRRERAGVTPPVRKMTKPE
jgi:hypothetical protein